MPHEPGEKAAASAPPGSDVVKMMYRWLRVTMMMKGWDIIAAPCASSGWSSSAESFPRGDGEPTATTRNTEPEWTLTSRNLIFFFFFFFSERHSSGRVDKQEGCFSYFRSTINHKLNVHLRTNTMSRRLVPKQTVKLHWNDSKRNARRRKYRVVKSKKGGGNKT